MTCTTCNHDCNQGRTCPARVARMAQDFETPQGRAETAEAERIAAESMTTALRLLAVFLAALIVGLTVWLSLPWIAERAAQDAAVAATVMRF